jgi:hypothetical protein
MSTLRRLSASCNLSTGDSPSGGVTDALSVGDGFVVDIEAVTDGRTGVVVGIGAMITGTLPSLPRPSAETTKDGGAAFEMTSAALC